MRWAQVGAEIFSTCGKAKYFAIILDTHGHVVGTGYNGGPKGMPHCEGDGACPRLTSDSVRGDGYGDCIAIHAESNSLVHSAYNDYRDGGTMIVTGLPCFSICTKLIANSGLRRVVWLDDGKTAELEKVENFLEACGVDLVGCEL